MLLMNLGTLMTIGSNPTNLFLIVLDNGTYEVTGGRPTAGSGRVDYASIVRAAGIYRVSTPSIHITSGEGMHRTLCQEKVQVSSG
jgi:thiamine pyrophosphate-dependent acetolactate synthase large subunit-like protein